MFESDIINIMRFLKGKIEPEQLSVNDSMYISGLICDRMFIEFLAHIGKGVVGWLIATNLGVPRFIQSRDAIQLQKDNIDPTTFAYAKASLRLLNANQTNDANYNARLALSNRIKFWLETHTFIESP